MAMVNSRSKAVFFVSLLRHLSHSQFKSFSTALDAGNSRKLRNQKNEKTIKKKLDTLLRF